MTLNKKGRCRLDVLEHLQLEQILDHKKSYCERCGKRKNLTIHHKNSQHTHPHLITEPTNLMTLCLQCHNRIHKNENI